MNTERSNQRYHDLDALRAFAMLLGVFLHAAMSFASLPVTVSTTQDIYQSSPWYGWFMDAIHGFRMPLFFLVSGIFTALLWKRRGLRGLIRHRIKRIGLPLLIGTLTIVPAVFAVNIMAGRNIWQSAMTGDVEYVDRYIAAGGDLNMPFNADMQPGNGGTPLHLAAASDHRDIAQRLLDAGANLQAPAVDIIEGQTSLASPLHWAAASGNADCLRLLVERGADVNAVNSTGKTSLDYAQYSEQTASVAYLLTVGAQPGSEIAAAGLGATSGGASGNETASKDFLGNWIRSQSIGIQLFALACFIPLFAHLWFLWYLLWLIAIYAFIVKLAQRFQLPRVGSWMFQTSRVWIIVVPATFALQLPMLQSFGPDTASGLIPWPPTLMYYGLFFFLGAIYQLRPNHEVQLGRHFVGSLALAALILPLGIFAVNSRGNDFAFYHVASCLVASVYVWLMISGLFGLFRHTFASERNWVRYLSDASYWIYLVHLPIVQLFQSRLCATELPSGWKWLAIVVATFAVTLLSYELCVRYTWIGAMLNGRKHRKSRSRRNEIAAPPGSISPIDAV